MMRTSKEELAVVAMFGVGGLLGAAAVGLSDRLTAWLFLQGSISSTIPFFLRGFVSSFASGLMFAAGMILAGANAYSRRLTGRPNRATAQQVMISALVLGLAFPLAAGIGMAIFASALPFLPAFLSDDPAPPPTQFQRFLGTVAMPVASFVGAVALTRLVGFAVRLVTGSQPARIWVWAVSFGLVGALLFRVSINHHFRITWVLGPVLGLLVGHWYYRSFARSSSPS